MTSRKKDAYAPPSDSLWFLPLGGSGEIGMNMNLYGTAGKWLMVDCGISFPDETMPGIEVIMPDARFISERRQDLVGLVVTHGHEDHLGAIEYLWGQLECPIYATPFNAEMIRSKFASRGRGKGKARQPEIIEIPVSGSFDVGPFKVDMIHVTHSIPEAHMLAITTPVGKILHTGDWKLDPHPVSGTVTDIGALKGLGKDHIMALVGDSTNALVPGHSGSELTAQQGLKDVFARYKNRIAVTCFASNIARLKSIYVAAQANGRSVALVGRSLWRNAEIAEAVGYLPEFKNFLTEDEAMQAPRESIVLVCTGCQGEVRAALARIAVFDHPDVELEEGDVVIFSSREIPGNEKSIGRVQNLLLEEGIEILTADTEPVHVSGHPAQQELQELYHMVKPKMCVPIHGELRHQMAHQNVARSCGVGKALIPANGQILNLGPHNPGFVDEVAYGRLGLDGKVLRALDGDAVKGRRKIGFNGAVVVGFVLDRRCDVAAEPQVTLLGLEDSAGIEELRGEIIEAILVTLDKLSKATLQDDNGVKNTVSQAVRRLLNDKFGKKPVVEVTLMRV